MISNNSIIHSDYKLKNDLNALRVAFEYDFKKSGNIVKYVIQNENIIYFDKQQNFFNNIDKTLLFYIGYSLLDTDLSKPYIRILKKYIKVENEHNKIYSVDKNWIDKSVSILERYGTLLKFDSCIQLNLDEQCKLLNNIILLNGNNESISIPIILNNSKDDFFFNKNDYYYNDVENKFNFEDKDLFNQYINKDMTRILSYGILSNCYYRGYGNQVYDTDPNIWYKENNLKLVKSAYHFLELCDSGE